MNEPTNDNDIDALLRYLKSGHTPHWYDDSTRWHAALTALIAERDMLSVEVGGLRSAMKAQDDRERDAGERCGVNRDMSGCDWPDAVADEVIALKQRVAELEVARVLTLSRAFQSEEALRHDRDLRERLVESALRGAGTGAARSVRSSMLTEAEAEALGRQAVWMAAAAFDEMRKGEQDA